jgi:hypothetical protein
MPDTRERRLYRTDALEEALRFVTSLGDHDLLRDLRPSPYFKNGREVPRISGAKDDPRSITYTT